jgi:hypothetical protein
MAHRQFLDSAGVEWTVYDVVPRPDERRSTDRRGETHPNDASEDRRLEDRRATIASPRPTRVTRGWLCFENGANERRRLQPIPENWHLRNDAQLVDLLARARVAPRRKDSGQGAGHARP